ncbi:hypothetical protein FA09DRAFT_335714 [Tilletiopsis washingtonensis]|uniref:Uncharacterized protein n=1 Tax=Tilletiopsis washingtonensis TaxID=58919 RepID=A0A316ZL10_9BASI|nr:hypothetical protein FA09DRAFT_335714 [Tilletiopsis washingtonensis]PWO01076.1 hypothetical protein FA09DRAFT_335714 [Tilletiopsis washingtonensis]
MELHRDHLPIIRYEPVSGAWLRISAPALDTQLILPDGSVTTTLGLMMSKNLNWMAPATEAQFVNPDDLDANFYHFGRKLSLDELLKYCGVNAANLAGPSFDTKTVVSNMCIIFKDYENCMSSRQRLVWKAMCADAVREYRRANDRSTSSAASTSGTTS